MGNLLLAICIVLCSHVFCDGMIRMCYTMHKSLWEIINRCIVNLKLFLSYLGQYSEVRLKIIGRKKKKETERALDLVSCYRSIQWGLLQSGYSHLTHQWLLTVTSNHCDCERQQAQECRDFMYLFHFVVFSLICAATLMDTWLTWQL